LLRCAGIGYKLKVKYTSRTSQRIKTRKSEKLGCVVVGSSPRLLSASNFGGELIQDQVDVAGGRRRIKFIDKVRASPA
jgi:hypothetical protein